MRGLSKAAVTLGAAALLVAGGGAFAVASASGRKITVCVSHSNHTLYKASKCRKHDKKLSWNATGPQGPKGATGSPGASGPPGSTGLTGPAGATKVVVHTHTVSLAAGKAGADWVACPQGAPTGGGVGSSTAGAYVLESAPAVPGIFSLIEATDGATPTGWLGQVDNTTAGSVKITVWVVCASP
jgi:hypothetical protein